eukprot:m.93633 g.93633  ORF g.93633 m.93633 type:complete len:53 (+) comp13003_c1_seq1:914-1072(+)
MCVYVCTCVCLTANNILCEPRGMLVQHHILTSSVVYSSLKAASSSLMASMVG